MSESSWDFEAAVLQGVLLRRHTGGASGDDQDVRELIERYAAMPVERRSVDSMLALMDLPADEAERVGAEVERDVDLLRGKAEWLSDTPRAERALAQTLIGDGKLTASEVAEALRRRQQLLNVRRRHGLFQILLAHGAIEAAALSRYVERANVVVLACPECGGLALQIPPTAGQAAEIQTCGVCMDEMTSHSGPIDPARLSWADYEPLPADDDVVEPADAPAESPADPGTKRTGTGRLAGPRRQTHSRRISRASRSMPAVSSSDRQQAWIVAGVLAALAALALLIALASR